MTLSGYWNVWFLCGLAWLWWQTRTHDGSREGAMLLMLALLGPLGPVIYFISWLWAKFKGRA